MQVSLVANQNLTKGAGIAIVHSGHTAAWARTLFIVGSNASITSQCCNESASLGRLWENPIVRSGHTIHYTSWYLFNPCCKESTFQYQEEPENSG